MEVPCARTGRDVSTSCFSFWFYLVSGTFCQLPSEVWRQTPWFVVVSGTRFVTMVRTEMAREGAEITRRARRGKTARKIRLQCHLR